MKVMKTQISSTKFTSLEEEEIKFGLYDTYDIIYNSNEDIQKVFIAHFSNIYSSKNKISCLIDNLNQNPIDNFSFDSLISPFAEEEIQNSNFSFEDNKAPGPDGFTLDFLKKFWNIFKPDIKKVFQDFFF